MATQTTNLNLTLPDGTDQVDVSVLNENFQKIDDHAYRYLTTLTGQSSQVISDTFSYMKLVLFVDVNSTRYIASSELTNAELSSTNPSNIFFGGCGTDLQAFVQYNPSTKKLYAYTIKVNGTSVITSASINVYIR